MSDPNEEHEPTPEEEARRIIEILADVDADRARIEQVALGSLVAGSNAAVDGGRTNGWPRPRPASRCGRSRRPNVPTGSCELVFHAPAMSMPSVTAGSVRWAGPSRLLNRRGYLMSTLDVPRPCRSRAWLEDATLGCRRCRLVVGRRSPVQRYCPECATILARERSRIIVKRRRRQAHDQ